MYVAVLLWQQLKRDDAAAFQKVWAKRLNFIHSSFSNSNRGNAVYNPQSNLSSMRPDY